MGARKYSSWLSYVVCTGSLDSHRCSGKNAPVYVGYFPQPCDSYNFKCLNIWSSYRLWAPLSRWVQTGWTGLRFSKYVTLGNLAGWRLSNLWFLSALSPLVTCTAGVSHHFLETQGAKEVGWLFDKKRKQSTGLFPEKKVADETEVPLSGIFPS